MNDYEQNAWDDIYYFCSSMPCQNKTHLKTDIYFPNSNDFLIYKKVNNFFENSFSKNLLTPTTGYGYFQSITFKKQTVSKKQTAFAVQALYWTTLKNYWNHDPYCLKKVSDKEGFNSHLLINKSLTNNDFQYFGISDANFFVVAFQVCFWHHLAWK